MDKNTWSVFVVPVMGLFFPVIVSVVKNIISEWKSGRNIIHNSRFDTVDENKRLQVLSALSDMKGITTDCDHLHGLKVRSLYRSIGLPYPAEVCDKILNYIYRESLPLNDPELNCFLRATSLVSTTNGFQQTHKNRKKMRWVTIGVGAIMLIAVGCGFLSTTLFFWHRVDFPSCIIFGVGTLAYFCMLIFALWVIIRSLWEIEMAKKFWRRFRHHLTS